MEITRLPELRWNVMPQAQGEYLAVASINGEAGAFRAYARRIGGVVVLTITTHGLPLAEPSTHRIVRDAKHAAADAYAVVEGVNR